MKTVRDLSRDELSELKQSYACEKIKGGNISYWELIDSENIPDEVIFEHYSGVCFSEDDFFCNQKEG